VHRCARGGRRLVDDVMTSGATLDELARVVKRAGVEQVVTWWSRAPNERR